MVNPTRKIVYSLGIIFGLLSLLPLAFQVQADNPTPMIDNLSPLSINVNNSDFYVTIIGSGFVTNSTVTFKGAAKKTYFDSPNKLTVQILSSDVTSVGSVDMTVTNPAPGGGVSQPKPFMITSPTPEIYSLIPVSANVQSQDLTLTVNGQNFIPNGPSSSNQGSVVYFNDKAIATTYHSAVAITAVIPANLLATAGDYKVKVVNPNPGGASLEQTFSVTNAVPTIGTISPDSQTQGSPGFTLTVNGTNFVKSSKVYFNGTPKETTYVSPTQVTAKMVDSDDYILGSFDVVVVNPGNQASNKSTFKVTKTHYTCDPNQQKCVLADCPPGTFCTDQCSTTAGSSCYDFLTIINRTYSYYPYSAPGPNAEFWYLVSGYPLPENPFVLIQTVNGWGSATVRVFKGGSYTITQNAPTQGDWTLTSVTGAKTEKVGNNGSLLIATGATAGSTVTFTNDYVAKGKLKIYVEARDFDGTFDFLIQHSKNGSYFYDWQDQHVSVDTKIGSNTTDTSFNKGEGENEIDLFADARSAQDPAVTDYKVIANVPVDMALDNVYCLNADQENVGSVNVEGSSAIYGVPVEAHKTVSCYFVISKKLSTLEIINNINGAKDLFNKIRTSAADQRPSFIYTLAQRSGSTSSYYPLPYFADITIDQFTDQTSTQLPPRLAQSSGSWAYGKQEISLNPGIYYIQQQSNSAWRSSNLDCVQVFENNELVNPPPSPGINYVCLGQGDTATCSLCDGDWCKNNIPCNPNTPNYCSNTDALPLGPNLGDVGDRIFVDDKGNWYPQCQQGNPQTSGESSCCSIKTPTFYSDENGKKLDYGSPQDCSYSVWGTQNPFSSGGYYTQYNIPLPNQSAITEVPIAPGGKTICIFTNEPAIQSGGGSHAGSQFVEPQKSPDPETQL